MSELATAMELLAERNELEALRKQVRDDAQRIARLEAQVESMATEIACYRRQNNTRRWVEAQMLMAQCNALDRPSYLFGSITGARWP